MVQTRVASIKHVSEHQVTTTALNMFIVCTCTCSEHVYVYVHVRTHHVHVCCTGEANSIQLHSMYL